MTKKCSSCGANVDVNEGSCKNCGKLFNMLIECTKCGGRNIRIDNDSGKMPASMWGKFSAKQLLSKYICIDCGNRF